MIYIRADMNKFIATGHVMRCLSIAKMIRKQGDDVTFILADNDGMDFLTKCGFKSIVLESQWNTLENELDKLVQIIEKNQIHLLLIDHYYVTEEYLKRLNKYAYIVYLDDLNMFKYPVSALICYANYYKKFGYELAYKKEKLFLGTKYVPLRDEFAFCNPRSISKEIKKVLLLSGGADPQDVISKMLYEFATKGYEVYAICGAYNSNYEKIYSHYAELDMIHVLQAVSNIKEYMEHVDLAISAAGSTLYELCAVGTPTISYTFADNQIPNARQFDKDGIIPYAGDYRERDISDSIVAIMESNLMSESSREMKSKKMQALVDGKGAMRIAKVLLEIENTNSD